MQNEPDMCGKSIRLIGLPNDQRRLAQDLLVVLDHKFALFGEFLCNTFTAEQFEVLGVEGRRTLGPENEGGLMVAQLPHFRIPKHAYLILQRVAFRPLRRMQKRHFASGKNVQPSDAELWPF